MPKSPASSAAGFKIAAIHGWRPHALGLCGPEEARRQELLKKFLQGKIAPSKMRKVFRHFMGAYAYYKLIAKSNNIKDQFDKRVIEAYWIGNNLLDNVKTDDLCQMIARDFAGPGLLSKDVAAKKASLIPDLSKPHHSFHVLTIGSVTGSVDFTGNTKLKDTCRVGWGKVQQIVIPARLDSARMAKAGIHPAVAGRIKPGITKNRVLGKIKVSYNPLVGNKQIKFGKPIKKEIHWDKLVAPRVKKGDWVSFHWNWLVKVLNKKELANLKKYTQKTLNTINGKK